MMKVRHPKTKMIEIPERYQKVILALIAHLDKTACLEIRYFGNVESKPCYLKSFYDKKQNIIFTTEPI